MTRSSHSFCANGASNPQKGYPPPTTRRSGEASTSILSFGHMADPLFVINLWDFKPSKGCPPPTSRGSIEPS